MRRHRRGRWQRKPQRLVTFLLLVSQNSGQQLGQENMFLGRKKKGTHSLIDSLLQQSGTEGPLTQTRAFLHEVRRKESRKRALCNLEPPGPESPWKESSIRSQAPSQAVSLTGRQGSICPSPRSFSDQMCKKKTQRSITSHSVRHGQQIGRRRLAVWKMGAWVSSWVDRAE